MKNRFTKRSVSAALIFAMLVMLMLPVSVSAGGSSVDVTIYKALSPGRWAEKSEKTYKSNGKTKVQYTYYKISVSRPGSLKFTLSSGGSYSLCNRDFLFGDEEDGSWIGTFNDSKRRTYAVDKGVYYLTVEKGKCKYTFTADASPGNYCPAKAKALKANTTATNAFTPKNNFDRWYKITITRRKKITIASDTADHAYQIGIRDKNNRRIELVEIGSGTKYRTKTAQNKGTYYIRVGCQQVDWQKTYDYAFGEVIPLKWN